MLGESHTHCTLCNHCSSSRGRGGLVYVLQAKLSDHINYILLAVSIKSVLAPSAVVHGFEPRSGPTKDYEIGICCFSAKHAALRKKSKDWLARNLDNV